MAMISSPRCSPALWAGLPKKRPSTVMGSLSLFLRICTPRKPFFGVAALRGGGAAASRQGSTSSASSRRDMRRLLRLGTTSSSMSVKPERGQREGQRIDGPPSLNQQEARVEENRYTLPQQLPV